MNRKELMEFAMDDGSVVLAEVDEVPTFGQVPVSAGDNTIRRAQKSFKEATQSIRPIANSILGSLQTIEVAPDEINVEFGIKLEGQAGVILAAASTEANLVVKLTWKK